MGSIRISCVGDLLPADTAYTLGTGIGSSIDKLISYYSVKENNPFLNSDIAFCNLEAPLILNSDNIKKPFEGNPDVLQLLKILNISVVSIANNHMLDHDREGFDSTTHLLEQNGFCQIGSIQNEISSICWLEQKGIKFAFAAFNAIYDHPESTLIAPLESGIIFNTLNEIKKQSPDFIIFSLHWGNEYITWPSLSQIDLSHELIDRGVNVIIGHHPHVVQPIEKYNGGIILYSLGNFLFDMFWTKNVQNGMRVDLLFNEDRSIDYELKPFRIQSDFTQDYTKTSEVLSILSNAGNKYRMYLARPREKYQKSYLAECKKSRLKARIQMKWYLLKKVFILSPQSRSLLLKNIKMKFLFL
jgi:poly-gamma-glutamate synthesis protein (capsule biosynthesis protein)